ncbi:MAG: carboxylesterase family protein [Christensenella sp.]|nr:carboxylesterase family protein [Christensenella sp.]
MAEPTVHTAVGTLRGRETDGVLSWKGVPYAHPPVGALRLKPPVVPFCWEGVRQAAQYGPSCPQASRKKRLTSEDCLYLNIWAPAEKSEKCCPVLFFIHGGSFAGGSGSDPAYDGANLARTAGAVVVTVNYRVGSLGFLDFSFLSEELKPNCGLHDVIGALRWVRSHIAAFGGDAENVTVFGQSAGGTMTAALTTIPAAQGLFSKAIVMSGGPTLLQSREEGQKTARQFLDFMKINDARTLMEMPAETLTEKQGAFASACGLGAGTFRISVDGTLVEDYPIPAAMQASRPSVPVLMGTTKEEMSFLLIKPVAKVLDIDGIMNAGVSHEDQNSLHVIPDTYQRHYGKKRGLSMMYTDMVFRMGNLWFAEAYSRTSDIWLYRFDYETAAMKVSGLRTFHSCDIPFVFGNFKAGLGKLVFLLTFSMKKAKKISREIQRDFITFAKTGVLPWQKCAGSDALAKCYREDSVLEPPVHPEIHESYMKTHFRKTSFQSGKKK